MSVTSLKISAENSAAQNQNSLPDALANYLNQLAENGRAAARRVAAAESQQKNAALHALADLIEQKADQLMRANAEDIEAAKSNGLDAALMDRLELTPARVEAMADGVRQVAALPDPVGAITDLTVRPSGIQVGKMRVPLGVVGIIYESRPNVTADAAALCLKSGNAAILRGGSEALKSNLAIAACIRDALVAADLPADAVQVVEHSDRALVHAMIGRTDCLDVIVPRGGKGLVAAISEHARVPVIKHLDGICHVYIDVAADAEKALAIAVNAKTQRLGTCNTMETLLVHQQVAQAMLPDIVAALRQADIEVRGCERSAQIVAGLTPAAEADWGTEYLGPILSVRIVDDLDEAIAHINQWGSHHTDSIVTQDYSHSMRFLREVDSSSVMVNASTRFADGFEYGLGAEIGISTDKFHARGPVGLEGLTSQKYVVLGDGHVR